MSSLGIDYECECKYSYLSVAAGSEQYVCCICNFLSRERTMSTPKMKKESRVSQDTVNLIRNTLKMNSSQCFAKVNIRNATFRSK